MSVRQLLENAREVRGGALVGDLDMPPALQRREQHEQVGRAIPPVLIIVSRDMPGLCLDRRARLRDQLFRGLIQAHHGTVRIVWPMIHLQHIFHVRHERSVGFGRDDELLVQMLYDNFFFSVSPIVLSLARVTMPRSTSWSSSSTNVHRVRPLGGGERVRAISFASASPSKMRRLAEFGE